jgi:biofilm PGA synthesis lipoprotein PgaB
LRILSWLIAIGLPIFGCGAGFADDTFVVLSYHDVKAAVVKDIGAGQTAVSTENLVKQFDWLKQEGYHVIAIDDLLQARAGEKHLPPKSVLLTFDDGYASFYSVVFPLLKKYQYPAVAALVGRWMEPVAADTVQGKGEAPPREALLTWEQVNEMARSGWVEMASHSDNLHRGVAGNPQGNLQPAGVTRIYDPIRKSYETDTAYRLRIREEVKAASDSLLRHTGKKPRVMVWPYGEASQALIQEANNQGMVITFGLGDGRNTMADLAYAHRLLVAENPEIEDFARMMDSQRINDRPLHVVHVDLDYIHDPDPRQTERNLGQLLERIQAMRVNTVYLQAFSDPDGDGNADAVYFPNRHLPVTEDLFNRAAWQLLTRARVKVYAWMPVLAFGLKVPDAWFVHEWQPAAHGSGIASGGLPPDNGAIALSAHSYKRLSPFNPEARRMVGEIYEDLAAHCNFSGILFHDDALLTDYEDVTPQALRVVGKQWQLPTTQNQLRGSPEMRMKWAKHKTRLLVEWTEFLTGIVRTYHPDIKTARNYYALPILQPDSEEWYAQSLQSGLDAYDYVAIEAMPTMEKAENPDAWLEDLVKKVAVHSDGMRKAVFEVQTVDWNTRQKIPMQTILRQLKLIQHLGGIHLGYYPDNVFEDHPRLEDMASAFALPRFP